MALPIRTTLDDVRAVCKYLASKPTGATVAEAKKVIDSGFLDGRKITALKRWGLLEAGEDGRLKITEQGRRLTRDGEKALPLVLRWVIQSVPPYQAIIERVAHRGEETLTATEVAAHWHEHFSDDASDNEKVLNDQAVCFFQLVDGAALGTLVIGRKGSPTRVDFDRAQVGLFADVEAPPDDDPVRDEKDIADRPKPMQLTGAVAGTVGNDRVFITHGKNRKIVDQLKEIVTFGKFVPIVSEEHETTSRPVPEKVMGEMRSCFAGIIHVAGEQVFADTDGKPYHKINENVLIEIGAAMALYGRNFILLVEKGIQLPSNLQGLYECRYEGEKLDGEATMKLLKAFNEFRAPLK
jgi:predicted nucleotide-binding protein